MKWEPIETAPRQGAWIWARSAAWPDPIAVIDDGEEGWWEDETGDYYVEARFNNGHGLTEWTEAPAGFRPCAVSGTNRDAEPVWRPALPSSTVPTGA